MIATLAPIAHALFVVLLNGLWEGALFALVAALVLRFTSRGNATTRYAVLVFALVASLVVPILTTALTLARPATSPPTSIALTYTLPRVAARPAPRLLVTIPTRSATGTPATSPPAFRRLNLPIPRIVAFAAVGAWLLGMLFVGLRLLIGLAHLEHLKRNALPLPLEYRTRLVSWANAVKGSHGVRLCRSAEITIPIAVGLFDAMILVPEALLEELPSDDIDRIILHELAHLRRSDDWLNAFERLIGAVLFFNPAVRWLTARLDLEREVACDDWVVTQTAQALPYAQSLVRVVESATWPYRAMAAPGVFITRRSMSIRIERLLSAHRDVGGRVSLGPASLALASIAALGVLAAYVSPSVADETPVATVSPAPRAVAAKAAPVARPVPHAAARPAASVAARPAVPAPTERLRVVYLVKHDVESPRTTAPVSETPRVVIPKERATPAVIAQETIPAPSASIVQHTETVLANDDYIAQLGALGYRNLSLDELIRMRSVGVTPDSIRDLAAAGLTHLTPAELEHLTAVGVNGDYVRSMRSIFGTVTTNDVVQLRAVGVTPDYVQLLKASGLTTTTISDVVSARAVGVDAGYIHDMRALFPDATLRQLRNARAVGVTPDYVASLRRLGFPHLGLDAVQGLQALGVTPTYADELRAAGLTGLDSHDLQRLRALGVDADFIQRVKAHGFPNPTVEQLVRIKESGLL